MSDPFCSIIHKQVYAFSGDGTQDRIQSFKVPMTAELVAVNWDVQKPSDIAFWYRFPDTSDRVSGQKLTTIWRIMVVATGFAFPAQSRHLTTLTQEGYAWHVLDADGNKIRRSY